MAASLSEPIICLKCVLCTVTLKQIEGSAYKSLSRPGRIQATATKLGIYSAHSPRSSINFLVRCYNYCKPLKKFGILSVQPAFRGNNEFRVGTHLVIFLFLFHSREDLVVRRFLFHSREDLVVRRGQMRRIGWVIKTLEAHVGQFLLGCKCLLSRSIVLQEQDLLGDFPVAW